MKNNMKKYEVLNVPRSLWKDFLLVTFLNFVFTMLIDASSFLMQFSKEAMLDGKIILSLALISLYYLRSPFETFSYNYLQEFDELLKEHLELVVSERSSNVLLRVKDKVIHQNEKLGYQEQMPSSKILKTLKTYIERTWKKKVFFITNGINILSSLFLFIGLILGLMFSQLVECIVFLIVFVTLRKYCGGYHADTYLKCNTVFAINIAIVMAILKLDFEYSFAFHMMLGVLCILIYFVLSIIFIISYIKLSLYFSLVFHSKY